MNKLFFAIIFSCFTFSNQEYVAVMTLNGMGMTSQEASILTERLTSKMIEIKKYIVIERANIDKVMKEQKFQYSGCTDTQCAVEIGKMLNSNYILIGNASKLGQTYSMDCRIIDVETSEAVKSASYTTRGTIDELLYGADNVAMQLCDLESSSQPQTIKKNDKNSADGFNKVRGNGWRNIDATQKINKSGFYVAYDITAGYLIDAEGLTIFDSEYDSGALTIGYEYTTAIKNFEGGISYDLLPLTYEGQIDGDRFLNIYSKYNFNFSNRSSWFWTSLGYNIPLSDLANTDLWYEPWTGTFSFSLGIEGERGFGVGLFYNYSTLTGSDGTLFNNMVYRSSIYYSF